MDDVIVKKPMLEAVLEAFDYGMNCSCCPCKSFCHAEAASLSCPETVFEYLQGKFI